MLVTTPDGRQMLVPDSMGGMFPSGDPSAPSPMPGTNPAAQLGPPPQPQRIGDGSGGNEVAGGAVPSVTGGQLPPQQQPPPSAPAAAPSGDTYAGTLNVPSTPGEVAKSNQAYAQHQAAQAAYNASPEGRQAAADAKQAVADQTAARAIDNQLAIDQAKAADVREAQRVANEKQAAIVREQQEWQKEHDKVRAQKAAYVDSTLKDVDNFKIDPKKDWDSHGTMNHIGVFIAMLMAGIGDGIQGKQGENPVLAMMKDKAQQSIHLQMDERDQLKEKNARAEHELDKFDVFSQNKGAQFELLSAKADRWLAQQIAMTATKYEDPQAHVRAQNATAALLQSSADHAQKAQEVATSQDMARKGLALQSYGIAQADRHFGAQMDMEQKKLDVEAGKLKQAGDVAGAKKLLENGVAGVNNKDGTPFVAQGTPDSVEKDVRQPTIAAKQLVSLIDEARRIRTGWTTSTGNSDEWQKLQAIWAANKGVAKNMLQLGALSESDYTLLDGFLGASDPTKFRDPSAGIEQARKNIITMTNKNLQGHGLEGDFDIPDMQKAGPGTTAEDAKFKAALKRPTIADITDEEPKGLDAQLKHAADLRDPEYRERKKLDMLAKATVGMGGATEEQTNALLGYANILDSATASPADKTLALQYLKMLASSSETAALRRDAQGILDSRKIK